MSELRARVIRASRGFKIQKHRYPEFPLVIDADGALVEPIFDFLRADAVQHHPAPGTLLDRAYVLCAWWDYVTKLPPGSLVNVDTVVEWTGSELDRLRLHKPGARSKKRLARCLDVIGQFHEYLLRGYAYADGHQAWRAAPYVMRLDPMLADREKAAVTFSYSAKRKGGGRPTPSEDAVERVLDALASNPDPYLSARNWLLGRWMRAVGLRRAGVASLSVELLREALAGEGILAPGEFITRQGTTERSRVQIRAALQAFLATGRTFISSQVTEKGDVTREIKIPVPLMLQTLDFVWGERAAATGGPNISRGGLWLSLKTRRPLSRVAIGDIVKNAFNAAGVRGSGHRLRACFAEEVVFRIYAEAKEAHGVVFDENQVLIDAAQELGHSDWRSLKNYLNHAARNYTTAQRGKTVGGAVAVASSTCT
ncbi:MAG: hypothetical protein WDA06_04055 [Phenylobacterium sp.]